MLTVMVWRTLIILWIYSGIIRNVLPSFHIFIYTLPFLLSFFYMLLSRPNNVSAVSVRVFFLFYSTAILGFQTFHYFYSNLTLKELMSGLVLYLLAPTIVYVGVNSNTEDLSSSFIKYVLVAVPVNLFFVFLQVIIRFDFFVTSRINERDSMTTDNYVLRAIGTYTHTTGYTTLVSVATAVILYINHNLSLLSKFIWNTQLAFLYLLSGSRSVWINLAVILVFDFLLKRKKAWLNLISFDRSSRKVIIATFFVAFSLIYFQFKFVIDAFFIRLSTASSQENSLDRILGQLFGWIGKLTLSLAGSGLGVNSNTNVEYVYQNPNWIENDLEKIVVESGILLGLLIVVFRLLLPLVLARKLFDLPFHETRLYLLQLGAIFSNLAQGSLTGQGSVAMQVWLVLALIFSYLISDIKE